MHAFYGKKGVPTGRAKMPFLDGQTRLGLGPFHLALRQAKVKSGEGWRDVRVFSRTLSECTCNSVAPEPLSDGSSTLAVLTDM